MEQENLVAVAMEKLRAARKERGQLVEAATKELRQKVGGDGVIVIASFGNDFVVSESNETDSSPEQAKAETLEKLAAYVYELARAASREVMFRELEKESAANRSPKAS